MEWPETLLTSSSYAPTQNKCNCWMWSFLWPLPCHALFFEEFKVKLTALPACPEMLQLVHVECPVWFWARAGEHPPCNRSPESIQRQFEDWANLKQPLCLKESVHRTHRTVRHKHPNLPETWTWRQSTKYLSKKPAYFWCQISTCPLLSSQCSTVWSIRKEACTASKPRTGGGSWSTRILGGAAKWIPLQRFTH